MTTDNDFTDCDDQAGVGDGEVNWRGPVIETIREQTQVANIRPDLLEYVVCSVLLPRAWCSRVIHSAIYIVFNAGVCVGAFIHEVATRVDNKPKVVVRWNFAPYDTNIYHNL